MASYKEIVTKAVIGKAKKTTTSSFSLTPNERPDTVLGCWVINHSFQGRSRGGAIIIDGEFDVNVWYSYENDTKTTVSSSRYQYSDRMNIRLKDDSPLTDSSEILVRSLKQPTVTNVNVDNGVVKLDIEKELGVEVVGNTKLKVPVEDLEDEYDEIYDEDDMNESLEQVDENYLD
ncbi:MAG: outer spore coat protein CotE [Bacilli bacterium]|jgi:spore coat protein E|nr:outer spore coat protein CotE [Bacilli bacterium]